MSRRIEGIDAEPWWMRNGSECWASPEDARQQILEHREAEGYVTRQGTPEQWDVTPAYRTPPTPAVADPLLPPPACERGTPRAEAAGQLSDGLWGAVRDWADEQPGPVTSLRVIESALGQVCARVIGTQLGVRLSEAQVAQIISDVRTWLRGVQERVNPENADGA
jgi:hypothetical protein